MSETPSNLPEAGGDVFGLSAVRELLGMISDTDITEIVIERGDNKLHVKRGHAPQPHPVTLPPLIQQPLIQQPLIHQPLHSAPVQPLFAPAPAPEGPPVELPAGHTVTAPMVGTFYSSPSPKDPPFVQEGDEVRAGDSIGIIEAMKMMNEIESDIVGRVARILVKNGQPVEYGQALMVIEPL
ncbi:MAG: acetyl-CoA carboxylase biotin carboxyl carrier protein [Oscillochloridaceae bacterium umkhey_bin13]